MFYGCLKDILMFLAAMSSSGSDNVTNSLCPSVVLFLFIVFGVFSTFGMSQGIKECRWESMSVTKSQLMFQVGF